MQNKILKVRLSCWYIVLVLICINLSCSKNNVENNDRQQIITQDSVSLKAQKRRIVVIQPFEGISPRLVNSLYNRLKPIVPEVRLNEPIEIPESSFHSETNHYRADSLIRFLWNKSTYSSVVIGITESGISRATNGYQNFEIIGLAFRPGHSCVVSTHLYNGKNVDERLFKSSLHELAHTQGLKHCERKSYCYMKGAKNGEYPIDELSDFCPYCKALLKHKGWNLK